jgi:signal transduction histidine kinase
MTRTRDRRIAEAEALAHDLERTNAALAAALMAAEEARARAEESEELLRQSIDREHFLAHASRVLSASIDFETTIQEVARLAVPRLADWCGVDIADENGELHLIAVEHSDPDKVELARKFRQDYPDPPDAPTGVRAVIRTGKTEFYPEITDELVAASAKSEEHLALLRGLGLDGVIVAPLRAGDQVFGAMSLISSRSSRRYTTADVALVEELAHRAALAIQSARLYSAEQAARKAAEDIAARASRLQHVTAALSQAATPTSVAEAALADSVYALGATHGALYMVSVDGNSLELVKGIGLNEEGLSSFGVIALNADLPVAEAARERRPVFLESRQVIDDRYELLRNQQPETNAWAISPLTIGDRILGAVAWGYREARRFDTTDADFIQALAHQSALAIERSQLYAAERVARESAQSANRAKSDFLATMSHELRTPINAIQGYAQLLDLGIPGPVTGQQREYLNRLTASSEHLLGLVNEVLDLAKIESGTIHVDRASLPAGETVDAALSLIRPQATAKGIVVSEECEGARDARYIGDEHRVRQVLTNLLSNAVKFTEPGGRVNVSCAVSPDAPDLVRQQWQGYTIAFTVTDTGSGIARDQLERIFDPFTQADTVQRNPYIRGASGTGLGLTISRRLARLMGGELKVESTPGVGSSFTLWLPLAGDSSDSIIPIAAQPASNPAAEQDEVVATSADAPIPGLATVAEGLLRETRTVLHDFVRGVRASPAISVARSASDSQIEDHFATFIADVSIGLRLLEIAGSDPSDLLRDSSAIIRTIMEQHGRQRFRLGWSEEGIEAEMKVLDQVTCAAVRRVAGVSADEQDRACGAVSQFVAQAARHTIASYRISAATLQAGPLRR